MKRGVNQKFWLVPHHVGESQFSTPSPFGFGIYEDNIHMCCTSLLVLILCSFHQMFALTCPFVVPQSWALFHCTVLTCCCSLQCPALAALAKWAYTVQNWSALVCSCCLAAPACAGCTVLHCPALACLH